MTLKHTVDKQEDRRVEIILAGRWCFLNFGFAKTSLDDIAKRAAISRTLLYRTFKNKEEIFKAVFRHWLMAHLPEAEAAANRAGDPYERLLEVCQIVAINPWNDMFGAPMCGEFFEACDRIDQETSARHRQTAIACVAKVLGDQAAADVFVLALDGLLADDPKTEVLRERVKLLASRFAKPTKEA
jgi:AcrR family transcriptional regulator